MAEYNIFNVYDVLGSTVGDAANNHSITHQIGTISTATGNAGQKGDVYSKDVQFWSIVGVSSLPAVPNGTSDCAQSISISMSDYDMIFATRDTRYQSYLSDQDPGDVYIYATGETATCGIKVKASGNAININADSLSTTAPVTSMTASTSMTIRSPLTTISNGGATDFLAKSIPTIAIVTAVSGFATTVGALTPNPPTTLPQALADLGTIITAAGALATALSTLSALIPTTTLVAE